MRGRILGRRNKNITHIPYLSVPEGKEICFTRMQLEFQSVGRIQLRHTWLATTCKIDPWNPETFCVDEIYTIPKMFLEPHLSYLKFLTCDKCLCVMQFCLNLRNRIKMLIIDQNYVYFFFFFFLSIKIIFEQRNCVWYTYTNLH